MAASRMTDKILKRRREKSEDPLEEKGGLRARSVQKNYDLYLKYKQTWRKTEKYNKE